MTAWLKQGAKGRVPPSEVRKLRGGGPTAQGPAACGEGFGFMLHAVGSE